MRSNLLMVVGLCALGASANAQIISTSIPQAAAGAPEKKAAFHVMVGYASWDYAWMKTLEREDPDLNFSKPDGILVAGDVSFKAGESVSIGLGGWYNSANFGADLRLGNQTIRLADSNGDIFSLYGNIFYKKIGVQAGWVSNSSDLKFPELPEFNAKYDQTDFNAFLVGRFGGERWAIAVGLGLYSYGDLEVDGQSVGESGDTVASGFANVSVKLVKNLSIDAGIWYIGESEAKDDDATRLTIGVGYTF